MRPSIVALASFVALAALVAQGDSPAEAAPACGTCPTGLFCHEGKCKSSVKDASSPLYARSCKLVQFLATPTDLPGDCRCLDNRAQTNGIDACKRPYDAAKANVSLGSGPSFALYDNAHLSGGFLEKDRIVASVYWDNSSTPKGLLVGYDRKTWARTFVSGEWSDGAPKSRGKGPAFTHLQDVRPGKDGKWYALSYKPGDVAIYRIDPASGDRTIVWSGADPKSGQCASGDPKATKPEDKIVQYTQQGFAVDADGSYLLGYANPQRDGRGLVRISADGAKCAYVTASGKRPDGMTKGTGDEMRGFVQGFALHDGAIFAFTTAEKKLWRIAPATGDRTVVLDKPIGERWAVWDAKRKLMWTAGFLNSVTLAAVDLGTKKVTNVFADAGKPGAAFPLSAEGPLRINSLNYGPLFVDGTTGAVFLGQDSVGLVEYEPETGNSFVRSL